MIVQFFHHCIPPKATAQHRRHTRAGRTYQPENALRAAAMFRAIWERYRPARPLVGPLAVVLVFTWPHTKRTKTQAPTPKTTRPDCDNLAKLALDAATVAGWWSDDAEIFDLRVAKFYGDMPGIAVTAEEFQSTTRQGGPSCRQKAPRASTGVQNSVQTSGILEGRT